MTFLEASRFAQENGAGRAHSGCTVSPSLTRHTVDATFLETSAMTGENVEEVFLKCARMVLSKIESGAARACTRACVVESDALTRHDAQWALRVRRAGTIDPSTFMARGIVSQGDHHDAKDAPRPAKSCWC